MKNKILSLAILVLGIMTSCGTKETKNELFNGENQATSETSEGYIALQSEGGPIEFRNVYLE